MVSNVGASAEVPNNACGSEGREVMLLSDELSEPWVVQTWARSALLMGKLLGMVYNCSDALAHNQIAA